MDAEQPPIPPQIAAQQGPPPLQQFAQGAQGGGQGQSSDALLSQYIDQVGQGLTKIAGITQQTKPELIPILKQAVQAMAMFAGKIKTSAGQQQQGAPQGGSQGTGADSSPDAGGGASLGMPQ